MCFVQNQIVTSGRKKKRRMGIPRPGGDFVAPGKKGREKEKDIGDFGELLEA